MWQVEKHGKYLGIPTFAGKGKHVVFGFLLDKIRKKL